MILSGYNDNRVYRNSPSTVRYISPVAAPCQGETGRNTFLPGNTIAIILYLREVSLSWKLIEDQTPFYEKSDTDPKDSAACTFCLKYIDDQVQSGKSLLTAQPCKLLSHL
jgi:hypothetical protein